MPEEKSIVQRLLANLGKQNGLAIYGLDPVLNALKNGEVEVALVTDSTDIVEIVVMCKRCELSRTKIVEKKERLKPYKK